jgi:hypothetical protein
MSGKKYAYSVEDENIMMWRLNLAVRRTRMTYSQGRTRVT